MEIPVFFPHYVSVLHKLIFIYYHSVCNEVHWTALDIIIIIIIFDIVNSRFSYQKWHNWTLKYKPYCWLLTIIIEHKKSTINKSTSNELTSTKFFDLMIYFFPFVSWIELGSLNLPMRPHLSTALTAKWYLLPSWNCVRVQAIGRGNAFTSPT